eukprot:TRINITY_DN37459_c0_g1_i1.p2 TRINITY_DN37459_c0_g1~~TRINITY_DN37459_c0_g1_i1.p2  ORF type:complete len:251 (+),score=65.81 TRINITY_DN37459_c0_g1_i1:42-794(+)
MAETGQPEERPLDELLRELQAGAGDSTESRSGRLLPICRRLRRCDLPSDFDADVDAGDAKPFARTIAKEDGFGVSLFVLAPGTGLPLHDHPGMTVIQTVIEGSVVCRSFGWLAQRFNRSGELKPGSVPAASGFARVLPEATISEADGPVLIRPDGGGSLHELRNPGQSYACFVDVFFPPYSPPERPCTYFTEHAVVEVEPLKGTPEVDAAVAEAAQHWGTARDGCWDRLAAADDVRYLRALPPQPPMVHR